MNNSEKDYEFPETNSEIDTITEELKWNEFCSEVANLPYAESPQTLISNNGFEVPSKEEFLAAVKMKFFSNFVPINNKKFQLITFSLKDENVLPIISEFPKIFEQKILNKKKFKNKKYVYTFEQRSESKKTFTGIHIHLLIDKVKMAKSQIIRECYNSLNKYMESKSYVDYKTNSGSANYKRVLNYLTGEKMDEDKKKKQIVDHIFRHKHSLDKYYSNFL